MAYAYEDGKFRWEGDLLPEDAIWIIGDLEPMTHCPCCKRPFQKPEVEEEECQ